MGIGRTQPPQLLLESALLLASGGLLLGRRQTQIRPGVGDGPIIDRSDVRGPRWTSASSGYCSLSSGGLVTEAPEPR